MTLHSLALVRYQSVRSSLSVVSRWLGLGNRTFLEVACKVVTWCIVAFLRSDSCSFGLQVIFDGINSTEVYFAKCIPLRYEIDWIYLTGLNQFFTGLSMQNLCVEWQRLRGGVQDLFPTGKKLDFAVFCQNTRYLDTRYFICPFMCTITHI